MNERSGPGKDRPDSRSLRYAADVTLVETPVGRALALLPVVPESASPAVREGLARRRLVTLTGECPCGAVFVMPTRREIRAAKRSGKIQYLSIEHEAGCPATDEALRLAGWSL